MKLMEKQQPQMHLIVMVDNAKAFKDRLKVNIQGCDILRLTVAAEIRPTSKCGCHKYPIHKKRALITDTTNPVIVYQNNTF